MKRIGLIIAAIGALLSACQSKDSGSAKIGAEGYAMSEGRLLVAACSSCHLGEDGTGGMASLAGWSQADMRAALFRYKTEDDTTVMHRLARGYSDREIDLISESFGQQND